MVDNNYCILYDLDIEDAFVILNKDNNKHVAKFSQTPKGLYAFKPPDKYFESIAKSKNMTTPILYELSNTVSTVKENRLGYTSQQYSDAKRARKLYHILGAPSTVNFKRILRQNLI